jgi:hypothetical protein
MISAIAAPSFMTLLPQLARRFIPADFAQLEQDFVAR